MLRNVTDGCLDVTENGRDDDVRLAIVGPPRAGGDPRPEGVDDAHARLDRLRAGLHRPALDDRRSGRRRPRGRAQHAPARPHAKALAPAARAARRSWPGWSRATRRTARATTSRRTTTWGTTSSSPSSTSGSCIRALTTQTPDATLEDAQTEKLDRLCRQLKLEPDDHLIEIGTGWGGMAIYAASEYGCRVTTTTISKEQREYAIERVAEAGLVRSDHGARPGLPRPRGGSTRSWSRSR